MNKLAAFVDLFRKGSEVADPALWKNRGAAVVALTALMYALLRIAKEYGYDLNLSPEDIGGLAVGIVSVVSLLANYATSAKVGLPAAKPQPDAGMQDGHPTTDDPKGDVQGGP